jgi:hypothetical protein
MAKKSFEEKLARLKSLEQEGPSENSIQEIRQALSGSSSILAAKAARVASKLGLRDLAPEIAEEAVLPIGNSRLKEAFQIRCEFGERNIMPAAKRMLLLPIALMRCEEAFALLLEVMQHGIYRT